MNELNLTQVGQLTIVCVFCLLRFCDFFGEEDLFIQNLNNFAFVTTLFY
jgi:hypothetical protein